MGLPHSGTRARRFRFALGEAFRFPGAVHDRVRQWLCWAPAMAWMALIFTGSTGLLAERRTSRLIEPLLRWLWPGLSDESLWRLVYLVRKMAHLAEYGVLAVLVLAALSRTFRLWPRAWSWRRAALAILICLFYATTDELHQALEPTRYASAVDVMIDGLGAMVALSGVWIVGRLRRRW